MVSAAVFFVTMEFPIALVDYQYSPSSFLQKHCPQGKPDFSNYPTVRSVLYPLGQILCKPLLPFPSFWQRLPAANPLATIPGRTAAPPLPGNYSKASLSRIEP